MRLRLLSPRLLILRLLCLAFAFGAAALWWVSVVAVLALGCDQVYGAAFLAVSVFFYVLALEVKGVGDRL